MLCCLRGKQEVGGLAWSPTTPLPPSGLTLSLCHPSRQLSPAPFFPFHRELVPGRPTLVWYQPDGTPVISEGHTLVSKTVLCPISGLREEGEGAVPGVHRGVPWLTPLLPLQLALCLCTTGLLLRGRRAGPRRLLGLHLHLLWAQVRGRVPGWWAE